MNKVAEWVKCRINRRKTLFKRFAERGCKRISIRADLVNRIDNLAGSWRGLEDLSRSPRNYSDAIKTAGRDAERSRSQEAINDPFLNEFKEQL